MRLGKQTRRYACWGIGVLIIVVLVILYLRSFYHITVHNTGRDRLLSVVLIVSGDEYPVGDLMPGQEISLKLKPGAPSALTIEFTSELGERNRVDAGGYFHPNFPADVRISLNSTGTVDMVYSNKRGNLLF